MDSYFRLDHHWTSETAFTIYEEIFAQLEKEGIVADTYGEFGSEFYEDIFTGSTARAVGYGYKYGQVKDDFTLTYPINQNGFKLSVLFSKITTKVLA